MSAGARRNWPTRTNTPQLTGDRIFLFVDDVPSYRPVDPYPLSHTPSEAREEIAATLVEYELAGRCVLCEYDGGVAVTDKEKLVYCWYNSKHPGPETRTFVNTDTGIPYTGWVGWCLDCFQRETGIGIVERGFSYVWLKVNGATLSRFEAVTIDNAAGGDVGQ